jgi:hypothetical protein
MKAQIHPIPNRYDGAEKNQYITPSKIIPCIAAMSRQILDLLQKQTVKKVSAAKREGMIQRNV